MERFADRLYQVICRSQLLPAMKRIKQNSVLKGLKGIKKLNRTSNFDSIAPSDSGRTTTTTRTEQAYESRVSNSSALASQYTTIKPLENLYTSVKIINGEKHNLEQEKHTKNRQKLKTTEEVVDNQRFLEKWMTLGSKEIIMVENYPQSDLAYKGIDSYGEEALKIIDENPFEPFIDMLARKKQMWGSKQVDQMSYRKDSLSNSLTYLLPQIEERALEMFDLLLKCEGLKHTEHPYYYHSAELINFVLKEPSDELKEELFMQIIKQQSSGKVIYLKLMALACCFIKPSLRMYAPLLNYFKSKYHSHQLYKEYYSFSFFNLIKHFDTPRQHGCTIYEAHLLMHMRKIPIQFDLPTTKTFFVESHTTVREFFDMAIDFYGLDEKLDYLLYYRTTLIKEGVLLDCITRVDMLSELVAGYQKFTGYKVLMVLKNMRRTRTSNKSFNLMYHYFVQQHLRNYYYLGKDENIRVAALKLHSEMEDQETALIDLTTLLPKSFMTRYVEKALVPKSAELEILQKVVAAFDQVSYMSKLEARKNIISIIKKRENFMTHFIRARVHFNDDLEDYEIVLGIKPTKLLLVDYESGRYLRKISFERILRWGKTSTEFCVVLDIVGKVHIETPDALLAAEIFEEYVDDLLRMNIPP